MLTEHSHLKVLLTGFVRTQLKESFQFVSLSAAHMKHESGSAGISYSEIMMRGCGQGELPHLDLIRQCCENARFSIQFEGGFVHLRQ